MDSKSYHPLSIIRLWSEQFLDAKVWNNILTILKDHKSVCDEIWFATPAAYPTLDEHKACAKKLLIAMEDCRQARILPGIQIANTIGHADQTFHNISGIDSFEPLMNFDGIAAKSCFCPRGPNFQNYNRKVASIYADCKPSSVWIDDDLRMNFHGHIKYGCFCELCLQSFSEKLGKKISRDELVSQLNLSNEGELRLAWTQFNEESISLIAQCYAEETHKISPSTIMAIQTCPSDFSLYNGQNYSEAFKKMNQITGLPVGSRPGVGNYHDHQPRNMINKAFHMGRAAAMHPDCVSICTSEIENYPHMIMGKSPQGTAVEASLSLALGCNSVSFAIICNGYEPLKNYHPLLSKLSSYRSFWEQILHDTNHTYPSGLYVGLSDNHVKRPLDQSELAFDWTSINLNKLYNLANIGLPLTPNPKGAQGTILCEESSKGYTDTELQTIFKGGVLLDGKTANYLQERGLGTLLGVQINAFTRNDCQECFTDDPLVCDLENGFYRFTQLGSGGNEFQIEKSDNTRTISHYQDRVGNFAGIATALVKNSLGNRIAIFGRGAFDTIISSSFRLRNLRMANWICKENLPAYITSPTQAVTIPRVDEKGNLKGIFLLNNSIDNTGLLTVKISQTNYSKVIFHRPNQLAADIVINKSNENEIEIPAIEPWSVAWLKFE